MNVRSLFFGFDETLAAYRARIDVRIPNNL